MSKQTTGEIVLYQRGDAPAIDVRLDGDTVWLTQEQMADLFGKAKSTINEHIKNVFEEGELVPEQVMRKIGISEFSTKPTNFYNLDANELKRLNTLVSAYFDAAEFRAMNHEPTYMKDWLAHLEQLIAAMGGKTLTGAGKVSHQDAVTHAEAEYAKYRNQLAEQSSEVEAAYLETVKAVQKKISGKKRP